MVPVHRVSLADTSSLGGVVSLLAMVLYWFVFVSTTLKMFHCWHTDQPMTQPLLGLTVEEVVVVVPQGVPTWVGAFVSPF